MKTIGAIESLWRYPVKSMSGEQMPEIFVGFSGVYGDRVFAFRNSAARPGFPFLNANAQPQMLLYRPWFRRPERAAKPPNLIEAMQIAPGETPANADLEDFILDVVTSSGETLAIDDLKLIEMLGAGIGEKNYLTLLRSDRTLTDCRPVSMISVQTVRQIEAETNVPIDKRRFRANIYFNFTTDEGFAEDGFVGRRLRIGSHAEIIILERDPRCKMISLDPETGEHNPQILRAVAKAHNACAGVYCAVLIEGMVRAGDSVELLD